MRPCACHVCGELVVAQPTVITRTVRVADVFVYTFAPFHEFNHAARLARLRELRHPYRATI